MSSLIFHLNYEWIKYLPIVNYTVKGELKLHCLRKSILWGVLKYSITQLG